MHPFFHTANPPHSLLQKILKKKIQEWTWTDKLAERKGGLESSQRGRLWNTAEAEGWKRKGADVQFMSCDMSEITADVLCWTFLLVLSVRMVELCSISHVLVDVISGDVALVASFLGGHWSKWGNVQLQKLFAISSLSQSDPGVPQHLPQFENVLVLLVCSWWRSLWCVVLAARHETVSFSSRCSVLGIKCRDLQENTGGFINQVFQFWWFGNLISGFNSTNSLVAFNVILKQN